MDFYGHKVNFIGSGSSKRFSIESKIKICEIVISKKLSQSQVSKMLNISTQTAYVWIKDYKAGLLKVENTYNINRKEVQTITIGELMEAARINVEKTEDAVIKAKIKLEVLAEINANGVML